MVPVLWMSLSRAVSSTKLAGKGMRLTRRCRGGDLSPDAISSCDNAPGNDKQSAVTSHPCKQQGLKQILDVHPRITGFAGWPVSDQVPEQSYLT